MQTLVKGRIEMHIAAGGVVTAIDQLAERFPSREEIFNAVAVYGSCVAKARNATELLTADAHAINMERAAIKRLLRLILGKVTDVEVEYVKDLSA